jgi:L-amino acid N-acyltransferase
LQRFPVAGFLRASESGRKHGRNACNAERPRRFPAPGLDRTISADTAGQGGMIIRPAGPGDLADIVALWNPVIRDTTITFSSEEKTEAGLAAMIAERRAAGCEFFVARDAARLTGFASYAQFRPGNGYAQAMEHTIILAERAWRRGVGRRLMAAVEDHARAGGAHTLFAGVSGENVAGVAFHEAVGFRTVARIPEAGRKFGRWLDLVLMMKVL